MHSLMQGVELQWDPGQCDVKAIRKQHLLIDMFDEVRVESGKPVFAEQTAKRVSPVKLPSGPQLQPRRVVHVSARI